MTWRNIIVAVVGSAVLNFVVWVTIVEPLPTRADLEEVCVPDTVVVIDTVMVDDYWNQARADSLYDAGMRDGLDMATRLFQRDLQQVVRNWFMDVPIPDYCKGGTP